MGYVNRVSEARILQKMSVHWRDIRCWIACPWLTINQRWADWWIVLNWGSCLIHNSIHKKVENWWSTLRAYLILDSLVPHSRGRIPLGLRGKWRTRTWGTNHHAPGIHVLEAGSWKLTITKTFYHSRYPSSPSSFSAFIFKNFPHCIASLLAWKQQIQRERGVSSAPNNSPQLWQKQSAALLAAYKVQSVACWIRDPLGSTAYSHQRSETSS